MQNRTSLSRSGLFIGGLALLCAASFSLPAQARERSRSVTRTGPNGLSTQRQAHIEAAPGYRDASRSQQGPYGGTRDAERGYDASTGTAYRDISGTTAGGKTWSRDGQTTVNDGSYAHSYSATGPNGGSVSRERQGSYD